MARPLIARGRCLWLADLGRAERYSATAIGWPDAAMDRPGNADALSSAGELAAFRLRTGLARDRRCPFSREFVWRNSSPARACHARNKNARRHPRRYRELLSS